MALAAEPRLVTQALCDQLNRGEASRVPGAPCSRCASAAGLPGINGVARRAASSLLPVPLGAAAAAARCRRRSRAHVAPRRAGGGQRCGAHHPGHHARQAAALPAGAGPSRRRCAACSAGCTGHRCRRARSLQAAWPRELAADHASSLLTIPPHTTPHCTAAGALRPDKLSVAVRSAGLDASADALGIDLADALWCARPLPALSLSLPPACLSSAASACCPRFLLPASASQPAIAATPAAPAAAPQVCVAGGRGRCGGRRRGARPPGRRGQGRSEGGAGGLGGCRVWAGKCC